MTHPCYSRARGRSRWSRGSQHGPLYLATQRDLVEMLTLRFGSNARQRRDWPNDPFRRNLAVRPGLAKVGNPHLMRSFTGLRHHQMPAPAACLRSHPTLRRDRRPRKRHRWHGWRLGGRIHTDLAWAILRTLVEGSCRSPGPGCARLDSVR